MVVEVDENELQTLRNAAKFIQAIEAQDGGTKEIQKWAKKINPKVRTEEDIANEYAAPIKAELDELKKWKSGIDTNIEKYNEDQGWNSVKSDYGYTEDGIKQLRDFADKNGIKNPKHAAAAWDRENPAEPSKPAYMSEMYNPADAIPEGESKKEQLEKIRKNPSAFEAEQVAKFYDEKRKAGSKWNLDS